MSSNQTRPAVRDTGPPPSAALPRTVCSCALDVEDGPVGPIVVLRAIGEIDSTTVPVVQTVLGTALSHPPRDLVVDLAGVGFCCVHGFSVLIDAEHTARAAGIGFSLSGLSTHLDRVATLLWTDGHLVRHRSAAAAVTAARVDQTYRSA